jgi:hypothetical protein
MVGYKENRLSAIDPPGYMQPEAEDAADEFMVEMRETLRPRGAKFDEYILNKHQWQRYRKKNRK